MGLRLTKSINLSIFIINYTGSLGVSRTTRRAGEKLCASRLFSLIWRANGEIVHFY